MSHPPPLLVLASGSRTRADLLERAGVPVRVDVPGVDEGAAKESARADGLSAGETALLLAELKARRVSPRHPGELVLGCDQMLECEGRWFDKPPDRATARAQLQTLAGRRHRLHSAAVIVQDGVRIWHQIATADLTMRPLSEGFLDRYLDAVGDDATGSVGAYRLEGLGAQLMAGVAGDHFTVLGLPLLPVLQFLRDRGVLPS